MFKNPKVYLIGYTEVDQAQLFCYLEETDQKEFVRDCQNTDISWGERLCSFYAKLCYKSLALGHNENVTKVRDIESNLRGCFDAGHGSVFEHFSLNFVATDVSRVFTHELVRHRVGTAYSQTSGRYVSIDELDIVFDPILEPVRAEAEELIKLTETYLRRMREKLIKDGDSFDRKKKVTSAIRRFAPNGQTNEIGFSVNIRQLRHMIQLRTSVHAEWEIREVFNQVANIVLERYPLMLYGMKKNEHGEWNYVS